MKFGAAKSEVKPLPMLTPRQRQLLLEGLAALRHDLTMFEEDDPAQQRLVDRRIDEIRELDQLLR